MKRIFALLSIVLAFYAASMVASIARASTTFVAGGSDLTVTFVDVGQGDAALLHDTAGCNVLIDGGDTAAGSSVVDALHSQKVSQVDTMVATHADSDHVGGLIAVLQTSDISVTQVLYNGHGDPTSATWNAFATAVASRGLTLTVVHYPAVYSWCTITAQVLNPDPAVPFSDDNDASVVLLVRHGTERYLFTGDISDGVDVDVISRAAQASLPVDVLKVSHHGSQYATSAGFLSLALPRVAVISVGPNPYGHPATETLQRLGDIGAQVYRTDLSGTITLSDSAFFTYFAYLPLVTVPASDLHITTLSGQTTPEYVVLSNTGTGAQNLTGWTLVSIVGSQIYTFPDGYRLEAGAQVRIESYTGAVHNPPSVLLWDTKAIWNNTGDKAELRNAVGEVVSSACYGNACP